MRRPPAPRPGRRAAIAAAPALLLAGCGFKLRGATELPFETFYTALPQSSQIGGELRRSVRINGATVVDRREDGQVRLDVLSEATEQEITALSTSGRPREFQLRYRLRWAARDANDADLIAPNEMLLRRLITVLDVQGILNADEVALLYRDMRADAVAQILRRLSTVKVSR